MSALPVEPSLPDDQVALDAPVRSVVGQHSSVSDHMNREAHQSSVADGSSPPTETIPHPASTESSSRLGDSLLLIFADGLDDLERTRIATENRLRALRQVKALAGTKEETRLQAIVESLAALEHGAELELRRCMRNHPLGPWVKAQKGIGDKQGARLLAAIGDPYIDHRTNMPRTVSQLWALCGYHVLPASHKTDAPQVSDAGGEPFDPGHQTSDAHTRRARIEPSARTDQVHIEPHTLIVGSGTLDGHPGHDDTDTHLAAAGVAARRRRGIKANWNSTAKMRAYLVAESCMKAGGPYRDIYLARRAHTATTHPEWTLGHSHNDALRVTAKTVLKDLWRESRRLHELDR